MNFGSYKIKTKFILIVIISEQTEFRTTHENERKTI